MNNPELIVSEKFGKLVINSLKDKPLDWFESQLKGSVRTPVDVGFHKTLTALPKETQDVIRDCIINATVGGIYNFLEGLNEMNAFEGGLCMTVNGVDIFSINNDGLHYELFGEDGWETKYSKHTLSEDIDEKYEKKASEK